jgi:hypothetical protein
MRLMALWRWLFWLRQAGGAMATAGLQPCRDLWSITARRGVSGGERCSWRSEATHVVAALEPDLPLLDSSGALARAARRMALHMCDRAV